MMSELDKHERNKQGKGTSGFMSQDEAMEKLNEYKEQAEQEKEAE